MKPDEKSSSTATDETDGGETSKLKEETAEVSLEPQPSTSSSFQNPPELMDSSAKDALFEVSPACFKSG